MTREKKKTLKGFSCAPKTLSRTPETFPFAQETKNVSEAQATFRCPQESLIFFLLVRHFKLRAP